MRARSDEPELELVDDSVTAAPGPTVDFEAFYLAEYPKVVRLLVGLTGRIHVAEELAQETMLSAHKRWSRVGTMDRPDLWLRRVAVNRAISVHRRTLAEASAMTRLRSRPLHTAGDTADATEPIDERLWSDIRQLPRRQSAALVLWAVEGLTFDEIGEVLKCSGETARTHLRRARQRLATNWKGELS